MKAFQRVAVKTLAYNSAAQYSDEIPLGEGSLLILTNAITAHALTGGSSPGVKFEPEVDTGGSNWVSLVTLQTTANGALAAAVADLTLTSATTGYRIYPYVMGAKLRIKFSVTGSPTCGSATVQATALVRG